MRSRLLAITLLAVAASTGAARGEELVKIGINGIISDAPFFIAAEKGYVAEQGLQVQFVNFQAGPQMVAPLATGELDAGAGASSAGLFNTATRGFSIRIVADKGSTTASYSYMPLLVRKDLVDSGRVKTYADLKGLKIAEAGRGGSPGSTLNEALKRGGLTYADVEHVLNVGYPEQVLALANHAVDGAITAEPATTQAVEKGVAVRFSGADLYPFQQVAVLLYGDTFITKRPQTASRLMLAYLKAVRFYNGAIADGRFRGKNAPEVIGILTRYTKLTDPAIYAAMVPNGCNPDGRVNLESLRKDYAFYRALGYLTAEVDIDQLVDHRFVDNAVKVLGPYRP